MKKFEAIYEIGPHNSVDIIVDARNEDSAHKKADRKVKNAYRHPMFVRIRELVPVDRLEYEQEIRSMNEQIRCLQIKLETIRGQVVEDSWIGEVDTMSGAFTDEEKLRHYEDKW